VVCLLVFGERLPGGEGYAVHIRPMPAALPGESGARHMNRALEALIRECPGQYLWGYNRYKKPKGATPLP
jgi:KDO2-lipid IV(A) lauroyltransferase